MRALCLAVALLALPSTPEGGLEPLFQADQELWDFVFFAVLEGLFEDRVPDDIVKRILEKGDRKNFIHFVYACPLCMPSIEAYQAFLLREKYFYARKAGAHLGDTRLPKDLLGALGEKDTAKFREGHQKLTGRFVRQRLERLRLTKDELIEWTDRLEEGRKRGMGMLEAARAQGQDLGLLKCPTCEGAVGATVPR